MVDPSMTSTIEAPEAATPDVIILSDGREFRPGKGGAGSPELAWIDPKSQGRRYIDPLPWCPMLGALGITQADFKPNAEFVSVTTKLGNLPTHRLVPWYGLMAAQCSVQPHVRQLIDRFGPEVLMPWIARAGDRVRDMAGERGTLVHDIAEDGDRILRFVVDELLAGRDVEPWFVERANVRPYVRALVKFFKAYPGIKPIWVEVTVFSRRYGIAGTLDLIAWVPGLGFVILDWKTSRTLQAKMSFQLAGYERAEYGIVDGQRVPVPRVDGAYIVHLMPGEEQPDGEQLGAFEVNPVDRDPGQLEIFDAMTIVGRWDHPSRIGQPLPDPTEAGLASAAWAQGDPPVTVVSPADAVMHHLHPDTFTVEVLADGTDVHSPEGTIHIEDPEVRLNREWDAFKAEERAWFADSIAYLSDVAANGSGQPQVQAQFYAQELAAWWAASTVPAFGDPLWGCDDSEADFVELLDRVGWYCDQLERPFTERPRFDWEARYVQLVAETERLRSMQPTATMADLGNLLAAAQAGVVDHPEHRIVTLARRGTSVDPEALQWGEPANPSLVEACKAVADRAARLPADLIEDLDAWKREAGVPNLRTISMKPEQLAVIEAEVNRSFDRWAQRTATAQRAILDLGADTGDLDQLTDCLFEAIGLDPSKTVVEMLTGSEVKRLVLLCKGIARGDIAVHFDGETDALHLTSTVDEMELVRRYASKTNARNAARDVATNLGLPVPRSTAAIVEDLVLVAALGEAVEAAEAEAASDKAFTEAVLG